MNPYSEYQETFRVRSFHIDYYGRLRMSALFNYLTECAGIHANALGVGYERLQSLGLFWVLSRIKLQIREMPRWHDDITVKTWPKGFHKLFAMRDFQVFNPAGGTILSGTSCWLLIDKTTLRPQRYGRLPADIKYDPEHQALTERLEKLIAPETLFTAFTRQAMYSELDVNRHLNNSRYVEWIMDCFDADWHGQNRIQSFQLNFTEEVRPGETVRIRKYDSADPGAKIYIEGIKDNGKAAFQGEIGR